MVCAGEKSGRLWGINRESAALLPLSGNSVGGMSLYVCIIEINL